MNAKRPPLVLFALDSANIDLVEKWAGEGYLPNMASMMQAGSTFEIGGPGVIEEIGAWTSMFSGVAQTEHGFYSSRCLKQGTYELEITSFDRSGAEPIWGRQGNNGMRSAILDPPEPYFIQEIPGIQITSLNVHLEKYARSPTKSEPPGLAAQVQQSMGIDEVFEFDEFEKEPAYYIKQLNKNLDRLKRRCTAFRQLLRQDNYDLIVIGFNETHDIAHVLWNMDGDPELTHGVRNIYQKIDEEIGLFLEELPTESQLMVLSAYGIIDQYPTARLGDLLLDRLGYRIQAKRKMNPLNPVSIARKLLPESLRYHLSQHLGFEFQQKLLHEDFETATDWGKTRAYTIPSLYQNWVRVNLKGREPQGIVEAADYPALLDEIEQEMRLIVDPATGKSAIGSTLRPTDLSGSDPLNNKMPDLIVYWKSGKSLLEHVTHPSGDLRQTKPGFYRNSFHGFHGFVIWKGPGIKPGTRGKCGILDIAPTCLDLLGLPGGEKLAGNSMAHFPQLTPVEP